MIQYFEALELSGLNDAELLTGFTKEDFMGMGVGNEQHASLIEEKAQEIQESPVFIYLIFFNC